MSPFLLDDLSDPTRLRPASTHPGSAPLSQKKRLLAKSQSECQLAEAAAAAAAAEERARRDWEGRRHSLYVAAPEPAQAAPAPADDLRYFSHRDDYRARIP